MHRQAMWINDYQQKTERAEKKAELTCESLCTGFLKKGDEIIIIILIINYIAVFGVML